MQENKLRAYPKVWNLGHPAIKNIFNGEVVISEKLDGSQYSCGVIDNKFHARSRNVQLNVDEGSS